MPDGQPPADGQNANGEDVYQQWADYDANNGQPDSYSEHTRTFISQQLQQNVAADAMHAATWNAVKYDRGAVEGSNAYAESAAV